MPFPTRHGKNTKRRRSPKRPDMSGINNAARAIDEAAPKVFSAVTKDHAHTSTFLMLIEKPTSGFLAWMVYWIKCFFVAIGVTLVRVLLIILLYILLFAFLAFLFFGLGSK